MHPCMSMSHPCTCRQQSALLQPLLYPHVINIWYITVLINKYLLCKRWSGRIRAHAFVQVISGKGELVRILETLLKLHRSHIPEKLPLTLQSGLRGLLPALLSSYGASCSSTDRAMLRLLLLVNSLLCEQDSQLPAEDLAASHLTSLFSGPLAQAG